MSLEQYKDKTRQELLLIMDIQAEEYQRLLDESGRRIAEREKERDIRDLEQQAKALEDYVSKTMDNGYILHLDPENIHHWILINLNVTALRLRDQAKALKAGN